jgi:hypothetical protein
MAFHPPRVLCAATLLAQLALAAPAPAATEATTEDWPRQLESTAGTIVVYQPQPESLQGTTLTGRAAIALTPKGKTDPVFGAIWFSASVETDRDQRLVRILGSKITRLRLPDAKPEDEQALAAVIEQETPKWGLTVPLDGLTAALAQVEEERAASDELRAEPPKIRFASEPTVLVVLDGQPIRRPIENSGIESVVNTPFPLFYDGRTQRYYLTNGSLWYQTGDLLAGPWQVIARPPPEVAAVVSKGEKQDQSAPAPKDVAPPKVLVATEPTELVVTRGAPSFAPVNGTELLYVTNTEENVFRDLTSQKIFVVLSGRWYSAPSFAGPWTFVRSDQLPPDFARIPAASTKGDVLAFVSGTNQAKEAVIDAQIPQTAEVRRDAPGPNIQYDGQPNFQPVPGTSLAYAVNTASSVLRIENQYYACVEAVWYVAPGPLGPWAVATSVPSEVQKIPPASPVYNVKYVTIYQATPQVVYVGYTPGYVGCYPWNGAVVYGTGYAYVPYVSPVVYYPRPVTWGFNVNYNPWTGWSYGYGWSAGFLSYGVTWGGAYYRPAWRPVYGGGWYGPGGYRPPPPRPPYGGWYGPGYRPARPMPVPVGGRPAGPVYVGGRPPPSSLYQRPVNAGAVVAPRPVSPGPPARPSARPATAPRPMPNNVYADKNGNVLRQNRDGTWQQREQGSWKPPPAGRPAPTPGPATQPAPLPQGPAMRPAPQPTSRPPAQASRPAATPSPARQPPAQIRPDYQARQQGNQRNQNYRSTSGGGASRPAPSRPAPAPRPAPARPQNR